MSELEVFDSPDSLLASFLSNSEHPGNLVLITGDSGAGKTTWCQALIERASALDLSPRGLVSPVVFESGVKVGIDLIDITNGDCRRLATRRTTRPTAARGRETLNWLFDDQVLAWGNELLQHLSSVGLLILDELGPLELLEDKGLTNGLKLLDESQYHLACVVVRPSLLATAQDRWPWGMVLNVSASAASKYGGTA